MPEFPLTTTIRCARCHHMSEGTIPSSEELEWYSRATIDGHVVYVSLDAETCPSCQDIPDEQIIRYCIPGFSYCQEGRALHETFARQDRHASDLAWEWGSENARTETQNAWVSRRAWERHCLVCQGGRLPEWSY